MKLARAIAAGCRQPRLPWRPKTRLFALAMTIVFLYCPGREARAAPGSPPAKAAPAPPRRAAQGESQIEEFDIIGKIYKPEVFVFLGRKSLGLNWDLDDPRFKRSFLDAVINSVWGPPF
ncbi:MAG: hypothetical protein RBU30_13035 [Polyangia bacterium]|jgi:hypothetical protein|nr:hypothetical protein [Polyangia bacterium]